LEKSVEHVTLCKEDSPNAHDVMKTAANIHANVATYSQAYRDVGIVQSEKIAASVDSFELIIPYMQKLQDRNPRMRVQYEYTEKEMHLCKLFVCPGIMNQILHHVIPVVSLDAAHLKSQWRGTLFAASVKT
jgi:hypothetical protein